MRLYDKDTDPRQNSGLMIIVPVHQRRAHIGFSSGFPVGDDHFVRVRELEEVTDHGLMAALNSDIRGWTLLGPARSGHQLELRTAPSRQETLAAHNTMSSTNTTAHLLSL